jgi:FemAB-related protein (PEP-CTERM system-associated)
MRLIHYTDEYLDRWESYVKKSDASSLYHKIGWKKVIEKSFGHETRYLLAEDDGSIVGVLPLVLISHPLFAKCVVSMPFLNYGGICADSEEAEHLLLEEAVEITRSANADYLELRQLRRVDCHLTSSEEKVTMTVDLESDPDLLWGRFNPKLRQTIRKAEKSGLQLSVAGEENLRAFYEVFSSNMRELGSPVYGISFFRNVLREFSGEMLIFTVTHGEKAIGAAFVGIFKKSLEGFWASSLREHFDLHPNEYLYWKQLEYGCTHAYDRFNLGRSSKDSGSLRFKKKFGAVARQLYYQYHLSGGAEIPRMDSEAWKYRIAAGVWKHLPLRITRMVGPHVRKYMTQ